MAQTPDEPDSFTSFSNPNYRLGPKTDSLHSEDLPHYEDAEPVDVEKLNNESKKSRKNYAKMDLSAMGIDISSNESAGNLNSHNSYTDKDLYESIDVENGKHEIVEVEHNGGGSDEETPYATSSGKGFLGYYSSLESSAQKMADTDVKDQAGEKKDINSPDSGIQADHSDDHHSDDQALDDTGNHGNREMKYKSGPVNEDIYAVPEKKTSKTEEQVLPPGWEKHEDNEGPYYWHIRSGTIQRQAPPPPSPQTLQKYKKEQEEKVDDTETPPPPVPAAPLLESSDNHEEKQAGAEAASADEKKDEPNETPEAPPSPGEKPIRFAVRSLGWVRIEEEDLTQERSSKAVNKCIVDLSLGRNDINDVVGRWGDGKDLYMDLDSTSLSLIDPTDNTLLNSQSIHSIRVWGVGRDNGRDFAYVARDPSTRRHMCHVFRCDTPARQIANTLKDICQRILAEKRVQTQVESSSAGVQKMSIARPDNLPNLKKADATFPTPMEEPKKVLKAHYLGTAAVHKPTGVDVLNSAMDRVFSRVPPEKWAFVDVAVAPSTITVTEHKKAENILAECRVRFLSFMGIAQKNVKICGFIMHNANEQFVCHVFHCEPSAAALCKTIEAACKLRFTKLLDSHPDPEKLRYQKCLDAHPQTPQKQGSGKGIGAAIKSVFGTLAKKKSKT